MITVRVLDPKTGKPVKGARVALGFYGFPIGGVSKDEYTDAYGEAHFDHEPCTGEVYVNGKKLKEGPLKGLVIVYI